MMSAAATAFHQDVVSRSKLARMDYHRKNGKDTAGLGKKRMTNAEILEKHGPCETYKLTGFMSFDEFREMPTDIQTMWINAIQDKYDVGLLQINREIFNLKNDNTLKSHLKLKGILKDVRPDKKRGKTKLNELRNDV